MHWRSKLGGGEAYPTFRTVNGIPNGGGSTGSTGTVGATGATGSTGATGAPGTASGTGATGPAGTAGTVGATGATGHTGANGTAGTAGSTGATGSGPVYATNSATGPASTTAVVNGTPVKVPWALIESTGSGGINVPITPKTSARVRVTAMICIGTSGSGTDVTVEVEINGTPLTAMIAQYTQFSTSPGGYMIPFDYVIPAGTLSVGVAANISILVSSLVSATTQLLAGQCSLDIEELPAVTG